MHENDRLLPLRLIGRLESMEESSLPRPQYRPVHAEIHLIQQEPAVRHHPQLRFEIYFAAVFEIVLNIRNNEN